MVIDATDIDDRSIVGEECHIVSGKFFGPRFMEGPAFELLDHADNLILLCRVHHKMVDDQCETYTIELLTTIKRNHEKGVSLRLSEEPAPLPIRIVKIEGNAPPFLVRLTSGREVMEVVGGTYGSFINHVDPRSQDEADVLASCLQEIQDWADLWTELEAGERVRAAFALNNRVAELENAGFWIFGAREVRRIEGGKEQPAPWPVAHINVTYSANQAEK